MAEAIRSVFRTQRGNPHFLRYTRRLRRDGFIRFVMAVGNESSNRYFPMKRHQFCFVSRAIDVPIECEQQEQRFNIIKAVVMPMLVL
jgi:hypothetical protein